MQARGAPAAACMALATALPRISRLAPARLRQTRRSRFHGLTLLVPRFSLTARRVYSRETREANTLHDSDAGSLGLEGGHRLRGHEGGILQRKLVYKAAGIRRPN